MTKNFRTLFNTLRQQRDAHALLPYSVYCVGDDAYADKYTALYHAAKRSGHQSTIDTIAVSEDEFKILMDNRVINME